MTDIVLRLIAEVDPAVNEPLDRMLDEAANEIESLRSQLAVTREEYQDQLAILWATETKLHAAEVEIERLRAVLQSLTKDPPATLDEPDTDSDVIQKMRAIAREGWVPCPNFPGCHCTVDCTDGWKTPSPLRT